MHPPQKPPTSGPILKELSTTNPTPPHPARAYPLTPVHHTPRRLAPLRPAPPCLPSRFRPILSVPSHAHPVLSYPSHPHPPHPIPRYQTECDTEWNIARASRASIFHRAIQFVTYITTDYSQPPAYCFNLLLATYYSLRTPDSLLLLTTAYCIHRSSYLPVTMYRLLPPITAYSLLATR